MQEERRKLIRPSFTEDDPFSQVKAVSQKFLSFSQYVVINSAVANAGNYGSEGSSAPKASFGNGKHMNPNGCIDGSRDSGKEGAETGVLMKLHIDMADERILSSKPMVDANAETFPVGSGIECSQQSETKFHLVGDEGCMPDGTCPLVEIPVMMSLRLISDMKEIIHLLSVDRIQYSDINSVETYLESDANFPYPDSAAVEQDHSSKFDLNLPLIDS